MSLCACRLQQAALVQVSIQLCAGDHGRCMPELHLFKQRLEGLHQANLCAVIGII